MYSTVQENIIKAAKAVRLTKNILKVTQPQQKLRWSTAVEQNNSWFGTKACILEPTVYYKKPTQYLFSVYKNFSLEV